MVSGKAFAIGGLVALLGIGAVGGAGYLACNYNVSEGFRVGRVNKMSYKGLGCKTHEGQLTMEGTAGNEDGSIGTRNWDFSVSGMDVENADELARKLEDTGGKRVKLQYVEKWMIPPCGTDTNYHVTGVEILE